MASTRLSASPDHGFGNPERARPHLYCAAALCPGFLAAAPRNPRWSARSLSEAAPDGPARVDSLPRAPASTHLAKRTNSSAALMSPHRASTTVAPVNPQHPPPADPRASTSRCRLDQSRRHLGPQTTARTGAAPSAALRATNAVVARTPDLRARSTPPRPSRASKGVARATPARWSPATREKRSARAPRCP